MSALPSHSPVRFPVIVCTIVTVVRDLYIYLNKTPNAKTHPLGTTEITVSDKSQPLSITEFTPSPMAIDEIQPQLIIPSTFGCVFIAYLDTLWVRWALRRISRS